MKPHDVYTLTLRDIDLLSDADTSEIIASGPWLKGENTLPHRIVLRRKTEDDYVVHAQIIRDNGVFYHAGNYIHRTRDVDPLLVAWKTFECRVRIQFAWPATA